MKKTNEVLTATCSLCGNSSGFDKESLKASTVTINGCKNTMCCDCEDEMFDKLLNRRMSKKEFWRLTEPCAIDEKEQLRDLYYKRYLRDDE
jgi:uncharacterized protein YlaI